PAHDQRQAADSRILDIVFLDDCIERTFLAMVTEFDASNVVRNGAGLARHALHLADRHEQELRIAIDERADEPRTGHAVDLHIGAGNPFHRSLRGLGRKGGSHAHQDYVDKAKLSPARIFKSPMDVVETNGIGPSEKLAILQAWEADEQALLRAEDEGMGGGEHAHLHKVQAALNQLRDVNWRKNLV